MLGTNIGQRLQAEKPQTLNTLEGNPSISMKPVNHKERLKFIDVNEY